MFVLLCLGLFWHCDMWFNDHGGGENSSFNDNWSGHNAMEPITKVVIVRSKTTAEDTIG